MTNSENLEARWQRYDAAISKANDLNKAIVFAALSAAGITQVVIGFDGEGDSGQIDGGAAFTDGNHVEFPETAVTIHRAQSGSEEFALHSVSIRKAVEELCYGYLEEEHGGWENNDGAFGEFIFDVAEQRIEFEFNARFSDATTFNHTY